MQRVNSKDGTPIAFDKTGHGPVIILVSGALGDRTAAAALTPLLSPHFTVVAYDRRGRGDSGDKAPYAVEREVEEGHRSAQIDASDLVEVLLAVADRIDPPVK